MSSPVERTARKRRAWKNRSMKVFMTASRTQGVGHPLGEAGKIAGGMKLEFEGRVRGDDLRPQRNHSGLKFPSSSLENLSPPGIEPRFKV